MGQKDMVEKILEDHNDVFADIVNVLLFKGKQIMRKESLRETNAKSFYKAETGKLHEQERDVSKYWEDAGARIAICGLENQTKEEKYMPLRVIGYDGASYRQQLLKENEGEEKVPVVSLVLYYGTEKEWSYPDNLKGVVDIPDYLEPFINDYRMNVFNIAFLDEETVNMFQSDFRVVADLCVQKRMNKDYVPCEKEIDHADEVVKLLTIVTGDPRYEVEFSEAERKEGIKMCTIMQKVEDKGRIEGRAEGRTETLFELVLDGILTKAVAVSKTGMSEKEFSEKFAIWKAKNNAR